ARGGKKPRRDSDEKEDRDEETSSAWLWVSIAAAAVLLIGSVTLFFVLGKNDEPPGNNQVAGNNHKPSLADQNKPPRDPHNKQNTPPDDPNEQQHPPDDPNKQKAPPAGEPPVSVVNKLTGEQIYKRLLQSTAWVWIFDQQGYGFGSGSLVHSEQRLV